MSAWLPIGLTFILLSLPALLGARRRPASASPPRSEFGAVLTMVWWLAWIYTRAWHGLRSREWAPLPDRGPAILISNHTCCIDHLILQARSKRLLGFVIAKEMYDMPIVHHFCKRAGCIPVNRDGRDIQATRAALRALEEGKVVPIFPEGTITPESGRTLGPMRHGTAYLALRSGVPVVPAFITGTPESREVGPSLWRFSRSHVVFGPPIDLSDIDASKAGDKEAIARVSDRFDRALRALQARSLGTKASIPETAGAGPSR